MIYVSTNFANRKKERVLDHQKYGQQEEEEEGDRRVPPSSRGDLTSHSWTRSIAGPSLCPVASFHIRQT
jgi:hypothetical protein